MVDKRYTQYRIVQVIEWKLTQRSHSLQTPDSDVHRANMGPIWVRQDPGGPHVGPMNFAIWGVFPPQALVSGDQ